MASEPVSERRMLEGKVDDDGADAPTVPQRRLSPSQYVTDETKLKLSMASAVASNVPNQRSRAVKFEDDFSISNESFVNMYPGAVSVLPGLDEARAHYETLKAAQVDNIDTSNHHHVGDGNGHVDPGNIISASVVPVAATVVEDNDAYSERSEELALLRQLVGNIVQSEQVSVSHDGDHEDEERKIPAKKLPVVASHQASSVGVVHEEGLQDGQNTDQQSRITESSQASTVVLSNDNKKTEIKIKKKKKTFQELCCGSHAVILDSVILTEET